MRILFVGNYDLAGSFISTRLYKESHNISWLTEENDKELWGSLVKGNVYRYNINYKNCSQIIKTESPDCIILLTQAYREVYDWSEDKMMSLNDAETEVLRAASALSVRKIIYLSSKEVDEDNILNPAMEKLRSGERLCQSVCRENNMECLIVRMGIVYGSSKYLSNGFIGDIFRNMESKRRITTEYTSDSMFDMIYGTDIADAVERLISLESVGTHIVTTGYPVMLSEIYSALSEGFKYRLPIEYGMKKHTEDFKSGSSFKEYTGWMPFYKFNDTIHQVIVDSVYQEEKSQKKRGKHQATDGNTFFNALIQNLILFAVLTIINVGSSDWSDIRFVDVKLLYVVIIAISFGMRQGIIATVLASIAYVVKLYLSEVDLTYIAYSIDTWIPFIIYGLAGAVVGYISDKRNDEVDSVTEEYNNLGEKYNFLKKMYQEVLNIKNQLQKQILVSKDSLSYIYEITEELDEDRPISVLFKTVKVIEDTMDTQSVAIYLRNQGSSYGRLVACSAQISGKHSASINFEDYKELEEVLAQKEMFVNTELISGYPSFAVPVFDEEAMVAVICVYNMPLDKYTVYYKNLFKTLVLITRSYLIRAYRFQQDNHDKLYIEGTGILCSDEFYKELESISKASEQLQYPYSHGILTGTDGMDIYQLYNIVKSLIRGTDIIGVDENGNIHIILLYVVVSTRQYSEKRFDDAGFGIQWEN